MWTDTHKISTRRSSTVLTPVSLVVDVARPIDRRRGATMSISLMTLVWHLSIGKSNEKIVLLKCADHASDDGSGIYPGRELLAASTELSISTVQRVLRTFVENGVLIVTSEGGGRNRATVYQMNIDRLLDLYSWIEVDGEEKLPPFLLKQGAKASGSKLGHRDLVYGKETGSTTTETGSARADTASEPDPLTFSNRQQPSSASADDGAAASPPEGGGGANATSEPPINENWRACEQLIRETVGDKEYDSWLKPATVEFDDGTDMVLSLEWPFGAKYVSENFRESLILALGRRLEIICLTHDERPDWLAARFRQANKQKQLVRKAQPPAMAAPKAGPSVPRTSKTPEARAGSISDAASG